MTNASIRPADLHNVMDAQHVMTMLAHYAEDPMGGGEPLSADCRENLIPSLLRIPGCLILLAFEDNAPVGLAVCFEGFSTFAARPLLNIHDLVVLRSSRGKGIGQALLSEVTRHAKQRGCCKVTLEVLSGNTVALRSYRQFGFEPYSLDPETGTAQLLQFKL